MITLCGVIFLARYNAGYNINYDFVPDKRFVVTIFLRKDRKEWDFCRIIMFLSLADYWHARYSDSTSASKACSFKNATISSFEIFSLATRTAKSTSSSSSVSSPIPFS